MHNRSEKLLNLMTKQQSKFRFVVKRVSYRDPSRNAKIKKMKKVGAIRNSQGNGEFMKKVKKRGVEGGYLEKGKMRKKVEAIRSVQGKGEK